jgi:hypothetical protein
LIPTPVELPVAGLTFQSGYPKTVFSIGLRLPAKARLKRKPNNKYDSNAIAVYCEGKMMGWVAATMAKFLAPAMDEGEKFRAWFTKVSVHPDNPDQPGLWLTVDRSE